MAEQDEHSTAKRAQIIAGAETVFTADGYEGASMSRIAVEAGVSKGTLYNYFTSKSDLFAAFVEQKAASTLPGVFETAAEETTVEGALHGIGMRMIDLMLSPGSRTLYRIVSSEAVKFPHLAEIFWDTGPQKAIEYMAQWLERQVEAGRLRPMDVTFAAEQFFALCQTRITLRRRLELPVDSSPAAIEHVVHGATRLFLAEHGTSQAKSTDAPVSRS